MTDHVAPLTADLTQDLQKILGASGDGFFPKEMTPLDVYFAYRMLLWRNPEPEQFEQLDERVREFKTVESLARGFLSSPEFRQNYFGISSRPDGRVVIVRDGDLRIAVDPLDMTLGWSIINGIHEKEVRWAIELLVQPGDRCIDMGANAGYFTAVMAMRAGETGYVYAYEPFPMIHRMLQVTIEESRLASRVSVRDVACSDDAGETVLYFPEASDNYGGAFVLDHLPNASLRAHPIRRVRIDDDLAGEPPVQFVKIDIEGSELLALKGAQGRLKADMPVIVLEVSEANLARQGHTPADVLSFLHELGYTLYVVEDLYAGNDAEVSGTERTFACENVLAIPENKAPGMISQLVAKSPLRN